MRPLWPDWKCGNPVKRTLLTGLAAVAIALGLLVGAVFAASGTLEVGAPWGVANQDSTDSDRIEVTYTIKASKNIPASTVQAVLNAITEWNTEIDGREAGAPAGFEWNFDLAEFGSGAATADHNDKATPGHGGGPGNGGAGEADITIRIKKGDGIIAGSAQSTFEDGFRVHVKI